MRVESGASSSAGQKRARNEDFQVADGDLGLFLVVDGMGGHAGGDVASRIVAETIHKFVAETTDRTVTWPFEFNPHISFGSNRMNAAIGVANRELARRIKVEAPLRGMGATMAGILLDDRHAVVANVGDCRIYLLRDEMITQITSDHSWVAEQVRSGLLDQRDAKHHPLRNLVTRAVSGSDDGVAADTQELPLKDGDRLLACTDGLHGIFNDDELLVYANTNGGEAQAACDSLVAEANQRGAPDNVTVVVVLVKQ